MIIPHLHFKGNCRSAIDLYEKAFGVEVETIVTSREYGSSKPNEENLISHATMRIHGQQIFLNDRFGNSDNNTDIDI